MYECLPMYHTTGGVCAIGSVLVAGGSAFIREKFSAREFWDDVVRCDGDAVPIYRRAVPLSRRNRRRLRTRRSTASALACGNGLRPDIWPEFQKRFRIPHILEFYGATEGNVAMFNFDGKAGAVGRIPWFVAHRFPTAVVRFDVEKEQPVRDAQGFCIRCDPDEPGEVIGKILNDPSKPGNRFEGYASRAETDKKILRDVFEKGDAWFRTGDLMRKDAQRLFLFRRPHRRHLPLEGRERRDHRGAGSDHGLPRHRRRRTSTASRMPGNDGRAGMAARGGRRRSRSRRPSARISTTHLPEYARPLFLRIQREIDVTGTFKQKKVDLVKQGFDPATTADPIYFNDPGTQGFVRLDQPLYDRLQDRQIRV